MATLFSAEESAESQGHRMSHQWEWDSAIESFRTKCMRCECEIIAHEDRVEGDALTERCGQAARGT